MKVNIIGGGIGGLTLAKALEDQDIPYELFEAAPSIQEVGAGILLGANAMQIYRALGLTASIYQAGKILSKARITDEQHRDISVMPLSEMETVYGVKSTIIHRAYLVEILRKNINPQNLHTNKRAKQVITSGDRPLVIFEDGTSSSCDILVAADGIHSVIRKQLFPDRQERYLGQTCWRGVVDYQLPTPHQDSVVEAWGPNGRFAFTHINEKQVYWYAVKKARRGEQDKPETLKATLIDAFGDYAPPSRDIILSTPLDKILRNDICDLKPTKGWHQQNIILIGDAAHATSPNMGQGGAQAIEDAHALAYFLSEKESIKEAFEAFENYRYPKTTLVVKQSKLFGEMAHWQANYARTFRNLLLRATPRKMLKKQLKKIYDISPELLSQASVRIISI